MNYLLQLCFDNIHRLSRKNYLFQYKGVRFKLVQNSRKEQADHLLTIIQGLTTPDRPLAFLRAAELNSALGWQNSSRVSLWEAGGAGWPDDWSPSRARPSILTFHRVGPGGAIGFDLMRIPHGGWRLDYETLTVTEKAMPLRGTHKAGGCKSINVPNRISLGDEAPGKIVCFPV